MNKRAAPVWPRPMPAYGRELLALRRGGRRPASHVVLTDDWDVARVARDVFDHFAMVCEPLARPWNLALLQGLDVVVVARTRLFAACGQWCFGRDCLGILMQLDEVGATIVGAWSDLEYLRLCNRALAAK